MQLQVLRVFHYDDKDPNENKRITLSPMNIAAVTADVEDVVIQGRSLRKTSVIMMDAGTLPLNINHQDLELLERAVGSFVDPEI
jgi:hypothetical protein